MLSSLLRRKGKTIALISVYSLIVGILASVFFYAQALREEAAAVLKSAPEMVVQKIVAGRHETIPGRYIDQIRRIRGAENVRGRLWGHYYDVVTGANFTVMTVHGCGTEPGFIVVGEGVARTRLLDRSDPMEFKTSSGEVLQLQVLDKLDPGLELVSSDLILVSEQDFRKLFGMPGNRFTDIVLTVKNPRERPTVAVKIAGALPDTRQILREEILRTYDAVFNWRSGILVLVFLGAVLAFAILAWDKASGLSSEEKREIGILKAIGWETSDVIAMKSWEGLAISFLSFCFGTALAYVHVFFTSALFFQPVLKGWAVLYPQFKLLPSVDASGIAALLFLTVVPYTAATIVPSWRAAIVDPDSVMR